MSNKSTTYKSNTSTAKRKQNNKSAKLTIQNGCFSGLKMMLTRKKTILGSDLDCDICLDNSLVSGEHAMITKSGGEYIIEDLNSKDGILINRREAHRRKLNNGDIIEIGKFKIKFSGQGQP